MTESRTLPIIALACACGLAIPALAQDSQPTPPQPTEPQHAPTTVLKPAEVPPEKPAEAQEGPRLSFEIAPRTQYTFRADLDDSPGSVAVWRGGAAFSLSAPWGDRANFQFTADAEASSYDFNGATGLIAGTDSPISDAYRIRLIPALAYRCSERWAVLGGGLIEFAGEGGADVGDSTTFGGYVGARYAFSEKFALTFGVQGKSRLEDSAIFLPILGFEWHITDKVTLSTDSPGVGLRLAAAIDEHWTFVLSGAWELREYRLEDGSPLPDGVMRDDRAPIGASIEWRPNPHITVALSGGAVVWQRYRFDDQNGDRVSEDNTDPAPFIGISARFDF